jgi:hypothetical protein
VLPSHVCTRKLEPVHTPKADATAMILSQLDVTPMRIFVTEIGNDTDNDRLELIVFWVPHCLLQRKQGDESAKNVDIINYF